MKKYQLNFIIDIFLLVVMMLTAGVGLLIKYILLPGFARNLKYGRDVDLYFWGWDRHQWGTVHLIISLILVGLVILHIVLHWRQIKCLYRNLVKNRASRVVLGIALVILCLVLALGPLLIKPSVLASQGHNSARLKHTTHSDTTAERPGRHIRQFETEQQEDHDHSSLSAEIPIYGYMTLNEIAAKYKLSAPELARHIGVPISDTGRKLGQLRRQYGFQMSAVRAYIEKNRTDK
jgi:hypothetical protein